MKRKGVIGLIMFVLAAVAVAGAGASESTVSINGLVKRPINLSLDDLRLFQESSVRFNEVSSVGRFNGVFRYRGVSLKRLLEFAVVAREAEGF